VSLERDLQALGAGPEGDSRQWFSYGTVDPSDENRKAVTFDKEGPLVDVKLHPSGGHVRCRVASWCAGAGEGEYYPFIDHDEVVVAFPEGCERAGAIIVGRCNNSFDEFPLTVAGNDVSENNFGFRRMRAPYVIETAQSYCIRNAMRGSMLMLEASGAVTLQGDGSNYLHIGPDFVGLQALDDPAPDVPGVTTGTPMFLQLNRQKTIIDIQVQGYVQLRLKKRASELTAKDTFSVITGGALTASEHVTTIEAVMNVIDLVLQGLATFSAPGALASLSVPSTRLGLYAAAVWPMAVAGSPNMVALVPLIKTALAGKVPNPTGTKPNVGCPGFLAV
jgi:hypothetical protein